MPAHFKDYYGILEVDPAAAPKEIRAAYKRLSLRHHPDTNKAPDATVRMQEINEAYSVLKDPTKRAQYDRRRTSGGWNYPPEEETRWRGTAEAEPGYREWEEAESEPGGAGQGTATSARQQRTQAEAARRNAVHQRNLGWIAFALIVISNLIGRLILTTSTPAGPSLALPTPAWPALALVTPAGPTPARPTPAHLPRALLEMVVSQMSYHVSYVDQGKVTEGPRQGGRQQALTLSVENATSGTYCLKADVYYDAGAGVEKSTWLHLLGGQGATDVIGNDWKINGVPGLNSILLVACGAGLDGIRLDPQKTVQLTVSTYQLPKFPVDSPHHLRITKILVSALNPWPSEGRQDYDYPPLSIPLAEGK